MKTIKIGLMTIYIIEPQDGSNEINTIKKAVKKIDMIKDMGKLIHIFSPEGMQGIPVFGLFSSEYRTVTKIITDRERRQNDAIKKGIRYPLDCLEKDKNGIVVNWEGTEWIITRFCPNCFFDHLYLSDSDQNEPIVLNRSYHCGRCNEFGLLKDTLTKKPDDYIIKEQKALRKKQLEDEREETQDEIDDYDTKIDEIDNEDTED